ncbi:mitochondrial enolase superfamily member 1 [Patagioenas fasciata]|uniref:mitochondrial enolase superfamily member 1 n=1 Tax=Patagioenas fasciata TaxID=372321 RepID=UPI003A98D0C2
MLMLNDVICAIKASFIHMVNRDMGDIVNNFGGFYGEIATDGQLLGMTGPEKGAVHLAIAAVLSALWAKREGKFLWKLLANMAAKQLLFCMDFTYVTEVLTDEEAYELQMLEHGYPAYPRSCAQLGCSNQQLKQMLDAKQLWEINGVRELITKPAEFKPLWIEEPTFPDEVMYVQMGHTIISKLCTFFPLHCHSRVIFKQLLQAKVLSCLQIDSCRLESVNENLSVLLMAKKFQSKALQNATA